MNLQDARCNNKDNSEFMSVGLFSLGERVLKDTAMKFTGLGKYHC